MPLASNGPIVLHGAPLTAPPPTGPHKPNLAIQARLTPELIAAIVEARKKGLQLQFDPYGPNAGFHIDGQHFPLVSVTAERTPHEIYAFSQLPQPSLQVVGKVVGRCTLQRTLTEEDQEKLRQSRSNAETNRDRTIGRIGVPDAPAKPVEKKKPPVRKSGVITASTVNSLRQSPAPGTAGNSPPPGAPSRPNTLDGPPNPFQVLLIHHLAFAPTTLKQLATTLKRQAKEIRPCLDSIATSDESPTGPRPDSPTWTLKPASYQYLRLAAPSSTSGGPWLTLTPDDIKRITADANQAFDELKLPSDAPARLALQPALPPTPQPTSQPTPPATSAKPAEVSTPKQHPLPARPTVVVTAAATANNGRLDVPKPSRGPSPAAAPDASSREMSVDRIPPARPPVRVTTKEKPRPIDDSEPTTQSKKTGTGAKSKTGANGKDKTKVKSKPIIAADSDGEDFVQRDRERKAPPVAAVSAPSPVPAATQTPPVRAPATSLHSRATSSSSSKHPAESTSGTKRIKREVDTTLDDLERELDSGYPETGKPAAPVTTTNKPVLEGKKRRINDDDSRVRERDKDKVAGAVKKKVTDKPKVKKDLKAIVGTGIGVGAVVRTITKESVEKRKRRDVDQDSDASFDLESKKKRRVDRSALAPPKREKPPRERERESESSTVEVRPKKPLPSRQPDGAPRVKEKLHKSAKPGATAKTNGTTAPTAASSSNTAAQPKVNGSSKKDRVSVMYTSSEDEGTPAPRRPAPSHAPARVNKPAAAPSPSDTSTPRERERDRDHRDRRKSPTFVLPPKRPPLPTCATAADVRERYEEVYRDYANMNARLADERFKVQKLLKDLNDGDHDSVDTSLVESLTKAYRETHEELVALRERLAASV
ncbi:smooth muscle caldesmon [Rhizoctonia solani AG-1 IB]|uniref:Smooth muscle caldesmon n=1 Tax=Thanatephorus cucumeris (strain AG1-IB / isolate 7/3/14) TaxID=1108050 RepID=A0A0B7FTA7_THACB|nr:smooth muscle caldesmon [Rhizoctonia solani AG-1 IB]